MKHEPAIKAQQDDEPMAAAIERARASYAADDGVEHRVVSEWLMTWGKPGRQRFEDWLSAWHG